MSAFPARFPGRCGACCERIHEGDLIRFSAESSNFIHDDCSGHEQPPERTHPVCDVCWLTHPEGACDR